MTKDEKYRILFEEWKKFVNEQGDDPAYKISDEEQEELDKISAAAGRKFKDPGFSKDRIDTQLKDLGIPVGLRKNTINLTDISCSMLSQLGFFEQVDKEIEKEKKKPDSKFLKDPMAWFLEFGESALVTVVGGASKTIGSLVKPLLGCKEAKKIKDKIEKQKDKNKDPKKPKKPKKDKKVKVTFDFPKYCTDPSKAIKASQDPRCPMHYNGTPKENQRKAKEYIQKQRVKNALSDWKKDKEFLNKVKNWSSKNRVPMKNILAVMLHETGGSMSPSETNKSSGCVGLIQFCQEARSDLGVSSGELKNMTRAEQWDYVEQFFAKKKAWKKDPTSISTLYLSVFLPAFAHLPDDAILATESGTGVHPYVAKIRNKKIIASDWKSNPANHDKSKKGSPITKAGLAKKLQRRVNRLTAFDTAVPPGN